MASMTLMLPIVEAILTQMETTLSSNQINPDDNSIVGRANHEEELELVKVDSGQGQETGSRHLNGSTAIADDNEMTNLTKVSPDGDRVVKKHVDAGYFSNVAKALTLSITYAGKCGGMATLTGTPANMIMKSQVDEYVKTLAV